MGDKEKKHCNSVSSGRTGGHDHDCHHKHDHCSDHDYDACGCGHSHGHGKDGIREYALTAIAGLLLAAALACEFTGFPSNVVNVFAVLSALISGIPIIAGSIRGLLGGRQRVCELAGIAIVAAILIGEYVTAAEIGFILSLGEIAEEYAYRRSKRDIERIAAVHPDHGFVERDGDFIEVPVAAIEPGDTVLVRPGDVVPADGSIASGSTTADESCLTGESIPVEKNGGDPVYSGSINLSGAIRVRVTRKGSDSTYSRIVDLVREAENRRPPTYPFIEKFISIYTPLTLGITVLTWLVTGSIERAITILIVACPCALLLSTPSAVIAAIGAGARRGILIKNGLYLEEAGKIDRILFDKTGTLTTGKMKVVSVSAYNVYDEESLVSAASLAESCSEHPVAAAIREYAAGMGISDSVCTDTRNHPGLGIKAGTGTGTILVGNARFMKDSGIEIPGEVMGRAASLSESGITPVFVSRDDAIMGIFGIEDSIRKESPEVIRSLKDLEIRGISILTGDRKEIAESVGERCGIDEGNLYYEIAPAGKKSLVESFQNDGDIVCFVGDGVNDGPALAQANIGVAMGSRENTVAIETSHVVLLRDDLNSLLGFIRLGRKSSRTIKFNVAFALSFTFILMGLAFLGIVHPAVGAVGHQAATLVVLANSALLSFGMKN